MKRLPILVILLALATAGWAADPPELINYKGVLRNADDSPRSGSHDMIFRFFDAQTGGTELLTEQHAASGGHAVPVSGGLFDVQLGSGEIIGPGTYTTLSSLFRDHGELWLEVQVESETLSPRVQVMASAFALNADRLDGRDSSYFVEGLDTAGHASSTPTLLSDSENCLISDGMKDCDEVRTVLVRVAGGTESTVYATDPNFASPPSLRLTLTGHGEPAPPALPDACHPGVELTAYHGGTMIDTWCLSPGSPLALRSLSVTPAGMRVLSSLHPGSWVTVAMDFPSPLGEVHMETWMTESEGRIDSAPVSYLADGTARVVVGLQNSGSERTTYVLSIVDCPATCTGPLPRARSTVMDAIYGLTETVTFDLPRCGGAVGTNRCTVRMLSPSGVIYDEMFVDF